MMDESELLRTYAENRSEPAFAEFVERRVGFVYATALRLVSEDAHTAQDVAQAVFVLVANKAATLARHEQIAGWLHTTTRNVSLRMVREARRRAAREQEAARMSAIEIENDTGGASANLDAPERLRPLLDEALGALREVEREAVLLRYFEGKAFAEIGVKLKMPENSARMRVARAVEKMRAAFARRGVTSSAAALGALMTAEAAAAQAAPAGLAASVSAGALAVTSAGAAAAVAGASATGAGAILAFMTSTKITSVAIVALLIAVSGISYRVISERDAAASLARARLENKNLSSQLSVLKKQEAAARAPAPAPKLTDRERSAAFLAAHPEIKGLMLEMNKATAVERTFRIAKALNLSPEESDQLAEIWTRYTSLVTNGLTTDGGEMTADNRVYLNIQLLRPEDETYTAQVALRDAELHALLGDANFEKFQQLMKLDDDNSGRSQSRELSAKLYLTDTPLTAQQAWGIDEIRRDLNETLPKDTAPEARWKLFKERAKSILSPEQMKAFADVCDGYIYEQTLADMERANKEAATAAVDKSKADESK